MLARVPEKKQDEVRKAVHRIFYAACPDDAGDAIERSFKEVKRRARVVGRFPNETSALVMVFA